MSKAACAAKSFVVMLVPLLCAVASGSPQEQPAENVAADQVAQQHILDSIREYADDYVAKLPNFTCLLTVHQFEAGKKTNRWREGDALTSRLIFNRGKEDRSLELVNNKPVRYNGRKWRTPLTTEGEFGILISNVVDPVSDAKYSWDRWDVISGHRVAVLKYAIAQEHSTLTLSLSDLAKATLPYSGSIYADPQTGAVWKITSEASNIPDDVRTRSIATTIEYGAISIAGSEYVLPVRAQVLLATSSGHIRNEMLFQGYRKFEAESTISFASPKDEPALKDGAPPPKSSPQ